MKNNKIIYLVFTAFVTALGGLLLEFDMPVISGTVQLMWTE
jgi:hypothetical protein